MQQRKDTNESIFGLCLIVFTVISIFLIFTLHTGCMRACEERYNQTLRTCTIEKVKSNITKTKPGDEWPPRDTFVLTISVQGMDKKYFLRYAKDSDPVFSMSACWWDGRRAPQLQWLDCGTACFPDF